MKPLRTIRQDVKPAEPVREPVPSNRAVSASAAGAAASGDARRESRSSLPGPAAGWRLPSGQLLVEYALQTCFTGSPFERPPFQGESADPNAEATKVSQGIHRLQAAIGREAGAKPSAAKDTARNPAKDVAKERSRS